MSSFKANKNLKADARESLLGNLTTAVASIFFYTLSTMLLSEMIANFNTKSLLISLLLSLFVFFVINTCANMLRIGLSCIFLKLQFRQKAKVSDLFYAFRNNSDAAVTISAFIAALELLHDALYSVRFIFIRAQYSRRHSDLHSADRRRIFRNYSDSHPLRDMHLPVPRFP